MESVLKICSSPLFQPILCLLCALIGVWGANRLTLRRVRTLEDELDHLVDRFERQLKIKAGRASVDSRDSNLREAAAIAASANHAQNTIRLPGRASS